MSHADAQSIIGGISIDEDSIVAEEHTHIHDPASNRNTFSFSLPFSNPLAGFKLPSFSPINLKMMKQTFHLVKII